MPIAGIGVPVATVQVDEKTVTSLIKAHHKKVEELKADISVLVDTIESELMKDDKFSDILAKSELVGKKKRKIRAEAVKRKGQEKRIQKLKDLRSELKDSRKAMATYCAEHYKQTQQLSFVDYMNNKRVFEFDVKYK